ncbi:hypothetical protein, partial [Rhodovulum sp. PH10]|uniref:hypothetical protein n=1 Tax=Rhodovulum sp. PH10 TaxID=1187851 RepID=UPI001ED912C3
VAKIHHSELITRIRYHTVPAPADLRKPSRGAPCTARGARMRRLAFDAYVGCVTTQISPCEPPDVAAPRWPQRRAHPALQRASCDTLTTPLSPAGRHEKQH